jgi:hypothetical protein
MKHKTKNRLIKKKKGRKTKKMKMRRGGGLFSSMSFGIPGFGSAGTCPDEQYRDPKYGWLTQKCYMIDGNKVLKTQYPDSGAADGAASGSAAKPWYQFWPDSGAASGASTKSWYQFW